MKKKSMISALVLGLLLLTGCAGQSAENTFADWSDRVDTALPDDEEWSYTLTVRQYPSSHYDEDGKLLVQACYDVPQMQVQHADGHPYDALTESNAPAMQVAQRFNRWFADWLSRRLANFGELCTLAEQDAGKAAQAWPADYYYTDRVEAAFWHNSRIACITLYTESFTGGPHPVCSRSALTFDMATGEEVTINHMTQDHVGLRDAVALEILSQIAGGRYAPYYDGETLFDDYEQTIPEWMTRAVFFGDGAMTVVFGLYDLAPSAAEQAFTVSYDVIAPYLNDYGRALLELN